MVDRLKKIFNFEKGIYIIFSIYIITVLMFETSTSVLENSFRYVMKFIRYSCYVYFILKIIYDWKNDKNKITIIMILISLLSVLIYFFAQNKNFIILVIVLFTLRNVNKEKIIEVTLKTYVIVFFGIIIGSLLGILPDWTYMREDMVRHSLGYTYPTVAMGFYLMIVMLYVYVKKNKITIYETVFLETMNVFLYKYTGGRASFILIAAILLFMLLKKITIFNNVLKKGFFRKMLKYSCYTVPTIFLIFILLMTFLYGINNDLAYKVDDFLNNRIELSYNAFQNHEITLFGQKTQWKGWGGVGYNDNINTKNFVYNYVDNSYTRLILDYGIIITILVILSYTIILIQNYNKKNYWLVFCIFIILILAEIEPCLVDFNKNIFIIFFTPLLEYRPIERLSYKNIKKLFVK